MSLPGRARCPRRGHFASVTCRTATVPLNQGQEQQRGKGQALHQPKTQNPGRAPLASLLGTISNERLEQGGGGAAVTCGAPSVRKSRDIHWLGVTTLTPPAPIPATLHRDRLRACGSGEQALSVTEGPRHPPRPGRHPRCPGRPHLLA